MLRMGASHLLLMLVMVGMMLVQLVPYLKKKDINLNIALAFGRYVEQNLPDVDVIYTRKKDVFYSVASACRYCK